MLDDQPANSNSDHLHFGRYLNALERTVLKRDESVAPLVVGIFGPWGSGKSTLLGMLAQKLLPPPRPEVGWLENHMQEQTHPWIVVQFSSWMYRNEKSLLLPLLATLATKSSAFEKLTKKIVNSGPELIKTASGTLIDTATTGLPLLTLLDSVRTDKEKAKDLQERIAEAIKTVTGDDKRLVFLIDDLDRCHDPDQILNLLEQIKLFLHLDRCLFFIAADREQIVKAIDKQFPGSGETYLEKFIQLPFDLPPHRSHHLVDILDVENGMKKSFCSLCEVLGNNPRKLKQIWNAAVLAMEILKEERMRVSGIVHEHDMDLMLKWMLLKNCGELRTNPYRYLDFEMIGQQPDRREEFIKALGFKKGKGSNRKWRSEYHRKLAVYLWNDLDTKRFGTPDILTMYAQACGEDHIYARSLIEKGCFDGGANAIFSSHDFKNADLSDGHLYKATFINCDLRRTDFRHADLTETKFIGCQLFDARFDNAKLDGTIWENCFGLDELDTEPECYERIADAAGMQWRSLKTSERNWNDYAEEALYKAYRTILNMRQKNGTLTDDINNRIVAKGQSIRAEVEI
ncbi:MAG TPA: P-loop NTPase fold protein [Gallionella sp.]|nr:P-loop NTPase fold protein [Gallionella sp.]